MVKRKLLFSISSSETNSPKDPETRCLWQKAINIKDYIVNDDTYVCSKHFSKDDIITHWVSGVPPQVITIKYKKCRLRRGAVPIPIVETHDSQNEVFPNNQNDMNFESKKYIIQCKKKEDIINKINHSESNLNKNLSCNIEDKVHEYVLEYTQESDELDNEIISKRQKLNDDNMLNKEQSIYASSQNDILYVDCANLTRTETKQNRSSVEVDIDDTNNILTYFTKKDCDKINEQDSNKTLHCTASEENQIINSSINWQIDSVDEKFEISEINVINELTEEFNKDNFERTSDPFQSISNCENNIMLFEDLLETYNEVSLPNNWLVSMVSKGHSITIAYSYMKISNIGMPYIQKQVFINNEMILRCGILNKEISLTSLSKNGKCLNVSTLSDIEDFIEKFDQMPVCAGFADQDSVNKNNLSVVICDGDAWRHNECSLILNKGQKLCLKCAALLYRKRSQ